MSLAGGDFMQEVLMRMSIVLALAALVCRSLKIFGLTAPLRM